MPPPPGLKYLLKPTAFCRTQSDSSYFGNTLCTTCCGLTLKSPLSGSRFGCLFPSRWLHSGDCVTFGRWHSWWKSIPGGGLRRVLPGTHAQFLSASRFPVLKTCLCCSPPQQTGSAFLAVMDSIPLKLCASLRRAGALSQCHVTVLLTVPYIQLVSCMVTDGFS